MIFMSMLYGENDFEETIRIASLAGLDADCTACTVGGILGTAYGFNALPEKYKEFINGDSVYYNYTAKTEKISWIILPTESPGAARLLIWGKIFPIRLLTIN